MFLTFFCLGFPYFGKIIIFAKKKALWQRNHILEFKYGKTAEYAVCQIKQKDYVAAYAADPRPVYAVGLNISPDRRTITDCDIVLVESKT